MDGAPNICDLVLEETAGKGKDSMDALCEFQDRRVKIGVGLYIRQKVHEERVDLPVYNVKRWRDTSVMIVERAEK